LDQVIYLGEKARIQPVFLPGSSFSISPPTNFISPNDTTFIVSPPINTTYTLTVVEPNGCVCTSRVTINVLNTIQVANAMTPNEDGINDIWIIRNIENYDNVEVYLYTRWGQRIFYSSGYSPGTEFDGTYLGSSLPVATYYYVVKFNFRGEKRNYYYTGSLAILR
jgi:gliding motility-associated-like protein